MFYTSRFLLALQHVKQHVERTVPLSDSTLKEVIVKAIGKPTSSDELKYFKRNRRAKPVAPFFAGEIRPKLKLVAAAIDHSELPPPTLPEVAFYGRTNAGKSCLINAICGRYGVCPVKPLPGTTRKVHFYKVTLHFIRNMHAQVGSPPSIILVDMPGYGYSSAKEDLSMQWNEFALYYLKHRETLKLVIVLVDSRIGLKQSDLEVINFCSKYKIKWHIVLAKADTMKPVLLAKMMQKVKLETSTYRGCNGKIIAVGATKDQNLEEIRGVVESFKVDKHMAHFWSRYKASRTPYVARKVMLEDTPKTIAITTGNEGDTCLINESSLHHETAPVDRYDLSKYIGESRGPYSVDQVALRCLAEVFSRFTPPPGFVDDVAQETETTTPAVETDGVVERSVAPTFVEMDGNLLCDLNITLDDTLKRNEEAEAPQENLIEDKISSYERRLAMGIEPAPKVCKPNIGRSYKRVMSIYRKTLAPKKLKWDSVNRDKLTWSAVYQKWERWSKKHPELARSAQSPTKRQVVSDGSKTRIRKHQLQVHQKRIKIREGPPKIKQKSHL
ncbi:GTP-binding protein engB, putative [Babesia bigemina]|uniref:GTP-binding protein engB, putative n=1 Tax=Babesia bigemina TaxID=5866 RepID=A0A061D471_BABBI|nr:GTP-binding protein engB, putative [Babesia bigemina]CDR95541.1 GTP-binding protein engB, putative [Babesia bigemina]|eukprot:XP_012767727.1 GTP-binding protein engB, putative [Babesia bigemina]